MRTDRKILCVLLMTGFVIAGAPAKAQVATANLSVQIVINGGCVVQNVVGVNFGTASLLITNADTTGTFDVLCTSGVPYTISLDGGGGGSILTRRMISGIGQIGYQLYSDASRSLVWGQTLNVDRVAGTGTGAAQTRTVYARVPPQLTPIAGNYTDTVTISVNY